MNINTMTLKDLRDTLQRSFAHGKKHYVVLFYCALILSGINYALAQSFTGSFFSAFVAVLFIAGDICISQEMILFNGQPNLNHYFVTFSRSTILKRLVPYLLIVSVLAILVFGVIGIMVTLTSKNISPDLSSSLAYVYISSILTLLATSLSTIILSFFPFNLLLQTNDWKVSLKYSVMGVLKNWRVALIVALVPLVFFMLVPMLLTIAKLYYPQFSEEVIKHSEEVATVMTTVVHTLLAPFFMTLMYQLYKQIYITDVPENRIQELA